jgi:hypothetical protein
MEYKDLQSAKNRIINPYIPSDCIANPIERTMTDTAPTVMTVTAPGHVDRSAAQWRHLFSDTDVFIAKQMSPLRSFVAPVDMTDTRTTSLVAHARSPLQGNY